jgi:hypothetical protein
MARRISPTYDNTFAETELEPKNPVFELLKIKPALHSVAFEIGRFIS